MARGSASGTTVDISRGFVRCAVLREMRSRGTAVPAEWDLVSMHARERAIALMRCRFCDSVRATTLHWAQVQAG